MPRQEPKDGMSCSLDSNGHLEAESTLLGSSSSSSICGSKGVDGSEMSRAEPSTIKYSGWGFRGPLPS